MSRDQGDTIYSIDSRFHLTELDANLKWSPEHFGTRQIGVAVVGIGRMGAIHLYNVIREPRAKLLYVLDSDDERLEFFRKKYFLDDRNVKVLNVDKWQVCLDDPVVEAVLISTPTQTHSFYCKSALRSSKSILCEKPLAESAQIVQELVELAKENNLKLICALQRRYDPSFRSIYEQVRRGDVGKLRIIKTCSRDSPVPPLEYVRTSGGVFHDCFVHDCDFILWISEELPTEIYVSAHCYFEEYKEFNDFDTALITMKFPSGLLTVTDLSRLNAAGYEQRVEVFGPLGCLKIDELTRVGCEKHDEHGSSQLKQCYSFASRYLEAYSNEITELFNHIEGNTTMEQTKTGYLAALSKVLDACDRSSKSGMPVTIEWSDTEIENIF